jgi:hypothetical protein
VLRQRTGLVNHSPPQVLLTKRSPRCPIQYPQYPRIYPEFITIRVSHAYNITNYTILIGWMDLPCLNFRAAAGGKFMPTKTVSRWLSVSTLLLGVASAVFADTITFGGLISQSTADGTGPAVNNTELNSILDGDAYSVSITFAGHVHSPGIYGLTGGSLTFSDSSASATETDFGQISLSVSPAAALDNISLLGCLATGSGCAFGNQLDANFSVPLAGLNQVGVAAQVIPGLAPSLDLLEDDGLTDIQGSVTTYSYSPTVATPEPASHAVLGILLLPLIYSARRGARKGRRILPA